MGKHWVNWKVMMMDHHLVRSLVILMDLKMGYCWEIHLAMHLVHLMDCY